MTDDSQPATVISLGGSLITTEAGVDADFLKVFKAAIENRIAERSFYVIAGGGSTARQYQQALDAVADVSNEGLDWMGIHATRLNGQLVRLVFADVAHEEVVLTPDAAQQAQSSVVVGAAGATPGRSSDYGSLAIAQAVGADHVVELSDIAHIYSADPDVEPDAEPLEELTWKQYRKITPDQWRPGLHVPLDPLSAEYAQKHDLEVAVMSGESLDNFTNYLDNNQFTGTVIRSA